VIFLCIRISREHGFLLLVVLREPLLGTGVFRVLATSNRYSVNGIPVLGLNRRAVCSGTRFREQPGFQSNPSVLPPERRCEEKGMLSATQTHQCKGAFQ
jgi:hypothetical protein